MAIVKREELKKHLKDFLRDDGPKLFLFFGERYLCRSAADELQKGLLDWKEGTIISIDGDQEDGSATLAKIMSFSLLPGQQIYRVNDTKLFLSKNIGQSLLQKAEKAYKANRKERAAKNLADMFHLAGIPAEDQQPLQDFSDDQWKKLFGVAKPGDLGWTGELTSLIAQQTKSGPKAGDLSERYIENFEKGTPPSNILILTTENVDKRKRLFTYMKKNGVIVDCSVAEGGSAAAQRVQTSILQEMMQNTLKKYNKTIEKGGLEIFLERVGFHPVAVVVETEKLALYSGERERITLEDLNLMVGRSREDALFELTDHFGKRQMAKTLLTLNHLLENGVHGLAILATMRNYLRKLLIFRTLQHQPSPLYRKGMAANQFQQQYLPQLKEECGSMDALKGHPYALFMGFSKAAEFSCQILKKYLSLILEAEFRLKGSGLSERIVLEQLIIALFLKEKNAREK